MWPDWPGQPEQPAVEPELPPATIDRAQITAICGGYHAAPFDVLGPHVVEVNGQPSLVVRAFRPLDERVFVIDPPTGTRTELGCGPGGGCGGPTAAPSCASAIWK